MCLEVGGRLVEKCVDYTSVLAILTDGITYLCLMNTNQLSAFLWISLLCLHGLISVCHGGVFSSDPRYTLWPNPARIPYQIQNDNISK